MLVFRAGRGTCFFGGCLFSQGANFFGGGSGGGKMRLDNVISGGICSKSDSHVTFLILATELLKKNSGYIHIYISIVHTLFFLQVV